MPWFIRVATAVARRRSIPVPVQCCSAPSLGAVGLYQCRCTSNSTTAIGPARQQQEHPGVQTTETHSRALTPTTAPAAAPRLGSTRQVVATPSTAVPHRYRRVGARLQLPIQHCGSSSTSSATGTGGQQTAATWRRIDSTGSISSSNASVVPVPVGAAGWHPAHL